MSDRITIPREALVSLVGYLTTGYPDPDNPLPPGPWDPVIHQQLAWKPDPQPWKPDPVPWFSNGSEVMLNPQPLPPRVLDVVLVAREALDAVASIDVVVTTIGSGSREEMLSSLNEQFHKFIDDCGNGRPRWPRRVPRPIPPPWPPFNAQELVILGAQLERAAVAFSDPGVQSIVAGAGAQLLTMGSERMQG